MKPARKFKAGLCFNLKHNASHDDSEEEYDEPGTIDFLESRLASFGFQVIRFEQNNDVFSRLQTEKPGWVLNITEGKGNSRSRESQIPSVLEWLNIPYFGSDPVSLGISLDKGLTSRILSASGIPVPAMFVIPDEEEIDTCLPQLDGKEYIVKPRWEGSSKGIFPSSIVRDPGKCREVVTKVLNDYRQPAVVEEFIDGDEITVAVIGNEAPHVFGMMRISGSGARSGPFIYSLDNKREFRTKIKYELASDFLPAPVLDRLSENAVRAFKCLELRDIARIDFRVGGDNIPRIIDVNPLPGMSPDYSDLMLMSGLYHRDFPEVVDMILSISLRRNRIPEIPA